MNYHFQTTQNGLPKLLQSVLAIALLFNMMAASAVTNRLGGLSTRSYVGTDPMNYMIAGILVNVSPKKVVIRASSVDGILNPKLAIKTYPLGTTIYTNNDWTTGASAAELQQRNWAPARTTDAGLIVTLNPGLYTAEVTPETVAGVGIVEVYELDSTGTVKLGGISTRSRIDSNPLNYMIAGLLVQGEPKRLIARAVSVDGIFNPKLDIKTYPNATLLHSNTDWTVGASAVELQQLKWNPPGAKDAALSVVLNPGLYTIEISPQDGVMGVGLVEVYEHPTYPGNGEAAPTTGGTTTPTTPTTPTEPAEFSGMIAAHNAWRSKVKVAGLTWSSTLATYAQQWANTLKAQNCAMQHRSNNQYGENLYWSSGMSPTSQSVVDSWASEIANYTYATNSCATGKMCGHYTQVVWKDTKEVGCGKASCGSAQIWVCNYNPPGNYVGQKPY